MHDAIARRWLHSIPADLDVVGLVTPKPFVYWAPAGTLVTGATHGSPNDEDAHVPVLFWGQPFGHGRRTELAKVVDMAPTLARVLGVQPTEKVDGRVLTSALRGASATAARGAATRTGR